MKLNDLNLSNIAFAVVNLARSSKDLTYFVVIRLKTMTLTEVTVYLLKENSRLTVLLVLIESQ
jgi:hypothetical protein